jgi:hypothetical protein
MRWGPRFIFLTLSYLKEDILCIVLYINTMSTHDSKNGLSNRGRPRLEVSPRFNGEEYEFCPRFTHKTPHSG